MRNSHQGCVIWSVQVLERISRSYRDRIAGLSTRHIENFQDAVDCSPVPLKRGLNLPFEVLLSAPHTHRNVVHKRQRSRIHLRADSDKTQGRVLFAGEIAGNRPPGHSQIDVPARDRLDGACRRTWFL